LMYGRISKQPPSNDSFITSYPDAYLEFIEAKANVALDYFDQIGWQASMTPRGLLPVEFFPDMTKDRIPLLVTQATFFACGGVAITICMHHQIADARGYFRLLQEWARVHSDGVAEGIKMERLLPEFNEKDIISTSEASSQPSYQLLPQPNMPAFDPEADSKVVLFSNQELEAMKAAANAELKDSSAFVSTNDVLMAHLAMRISAARIARTKASTTGAKFAYAIDLRRRMKPALPLSYFGNAVTMNAITYENMEVFAGKTLGQVALDFRKSVDATTPEYAAGRIECLRQAQEKNAIVEFIINVVGNDLLFTTWSKMGAYDADFGGGRPLRMRQSPDSFSGGVMIMEIPGEGIEAFIGLNKNDLVHFLADPELYKYRSK